MQVVIADEDTNEVPPGNDGELLMAGPQLSLGYWNDPKLTAAAFVSPRGRKEIFYRTGDLVRRLGPNGPILYLGRLDNQIKIRGYRIEPGEIEHAVREESGVDRVVAIGWPRTPAGAGAIEVFLETENRLPADLRERVGTRLPAYMIPRRFHCLAQLPQNPNGRCDRAKLLLYLEQLQ
jgi:acyl-CoA synthetase (AMP-forming)/AMP-acid ligase II